MVSFFQIRLWWLAVILLLIFWIILRIFLKHSVFNRNERILFFSFRGLGLFLLIISLLQPVLSCSFKKNIKPAVAVLFDSSLSMGIEEEKSTRFLSSIEYFEKKIYPYLSEHFRPVFFTFGENLKLQPSLEYVKSVTPEDEKTDFASSFASLERFFLSPDIKAIILLSDGRFNIDSITLDRIKNLKEKGKLLIPVKFIKEKKLEDFSVRFSQDFSDKIFTGRKSLFPVQIFRSRPETSLVLSFFANGRLISKKTIPPGSEIYSLDFEYEPQTEGIHELTVKLEPLKEDKININNEDKILVKVVKGNFKTLLLGGEPSWEYSFLKRYLENDPSLSVVSSVKKYNQPLYFYGSLNSFDVFILCGINSEDLSQKDWLSIKSSIKSGKSSLLLLSGTGSSIFSEKVSALDDILPFKSVSELPLSAPVSVELTPEGASFPVMILDDDPVKNKNIWSGLPPLNVVWRITAKPGCIILATVKGNSSIPLMGISENKKIFFISAGPLWRWAFVNLAVNNDHERYRTFFRQVLRELTSLVSSYELQTDKLLYHKGEIVKIYSFLPGFSEKNVEVTWSGPNNSSGVIKLNRNDIIKNRYEGFFEPEFRGIYTLKISDRKLSTRFMVGSNSDEFFRLDPDLSMLNKISAISGADEESIKDIDSKPFSVELTVKRELWDYWIVFIIISGLFITDWILRKNRGLP